MTITSMQRVMGGEKRAINHFTGSVGTVPKSRVLYYITIPPFSFLVMAELMTGNSSYFLSIFLCTCKSPFFSIPQSSAIKCSEVCLRKGVQTSHKTKQFPLKYPLKIYMCVIYLYPSPPPRPLKPQLLTVFYTGCV